MKTRDATKQDKARQESLEAERTQLTFRGIPIHYVDSLADSPTKCVFCEPVED